MNKRILFYKIIWYRKKLKRIKNGCHYHFGRVLTRRMMALFDDIYKYINANKHIDAGTVSVAVWRTIKALTAQQPQKRIKTTPTRFEESKHFSVWLMYVIYHNFRADLLGSTRIITSSLFRNVCSRSGKIPFIKMMLRDGRKKSIMLFACIKLAVSIFVYGKYGRWHLFIY